MRGASAHQISAMRGMCPNGRRRTGVKEGRKEVNEG